MQFIVKPNSNYRLLIIRKYYRLYGQQILYVFAVLFLFTSGLLFGLMWNFDNRCLDKTLKLNNEINKLSQSLLSSPSSSSSSIQLSSPALVSSAPSSSSLVQSTVNKENYYLIILILSCSKNIERRNAIRETWLKLSVKRDFKYYFIIGTNEVNEQEISLLNNEQKQYNDLLLFSHVKDTFNSLTNKLLASFQWLIKNKFEFKYLLKVDDDTFVRVNALFDELIVLNGKIKEPLYWGYFDGRAHVQRAGRWKESNWFLCDHYLPYALGGGYLLSVELIVFIVNNSHLLQMYHNEDTSIGVWLAPLKIFRYHDLRFDTEYESRGCNNNFLITHKQSVKQMREKYENLQKFDKLCKNEFLHKSAYNYNWNVRPTQCCIRNVSTIT